MGTLTINTTDGTGWVGDPVSGMNACWAQAVQDLQDALVPPVNDVTVTITRQFTGGGLASSTADVEFTSWSSMRSAYLALTPSNSVQAANWTGALLPSTAPTTELGNFLETPRILSVAVGRTTGSGFSNTITFGAGAQWDTTSVRGDTNSGAGHYTAYGVMMHELSETLGRIALADTLGAGGGAAAADMFVYSAAGVHCTAKATTRFITADGTNPLYYMNTVPGSSDAGDAASGSPAFNAFGTVNLACSRSPTLPLQAADWQWMASLGWNLSTQGLIWAGLDPTFAVSGASAVSMIGAATNSQAAALGGASSLAFVGRNASATRGRLKLGHQ